MPTTTLEKSIRRIVKTSVESFSAGFSGRHLAEIDDPEGTLNMKIHNVFISILGEEIQYYTALVRSFDSSLGNMLEKMAINIADIGFEVHKEVSGPLSSQQTAIIAEILERYKRRETAPSVKDYERLRSPKFREDTRIKRHDSDYYLIDPKTGSHCLIELKIGGDLDNKKARSEKEAILEQYAILSNILQAKTDIKIYFATAYNRYGEGRNWAQERVRQFFADEELLIGQDFWNFVCKSQKGYEIVIDEYRKNASAIKESLQEIKKAYLG